MARSMRMRIQYEGYLYHVINRSNYRSDIYATAGTAQSFLATVLAVVRRHGWRLHAYVIMRNHYLMLLLFGH
jgi:REP element-mobilizing transposase RayT